MIYSYDEFIAIIEWINSNKRFEVWADRKDAKNFLEGNTKPRNYTKKFKIRDYEPVYESFAEC